jgi:hypothetical protein
MKLLRSAVIQENGRRFVECDIADQPIDSADEYICLRLSVDHEGHPRVPECLLEALRRARKLVGEQSSPLEDPVARGF